MTSTSPPPQRLDAAAAPGNNEAAGLSLKRAADENFREMYRLLARGSREGMVVENGGACWVATGVPIALFNPAFAPEQGGGAGEHGAAEADAFSAATRAFYARRSLPWALVVPEHGTGPTPALASPRRLLAAGLRPVQTLPLFAHPTSPADPLWRLEMPARSGGDDWLDIQPAHTPAAIQNHRRLLEAGFGIPEQYSRMVLPDVPPPEVARRFTLYVARERASGVPVGSAALCESGGGGVAGMAGAYNVATDPTRRRRGIASALMRRLLADARERGFAWCVLQSSSGGQPLYAANAADADPIV
jgi:GNAT superfamily N-acetyltransferase